jgi:uncharacterized protein (TIGR03435 family)
MKRALAALALSTCAAIAQPAQAPAFEVASLKVSAPIGTARVRIGCPPPDPGILRCDNVPLRALLVQAYGVKNYQIEGPAWIDTEHYDLNARIPEGVPKEQIPAMLQALLLERFQISLHKDTRPLPVYELSVAKGGPRLKEVDPAGLDKPDAAGRRPAPPPPGGAGYVGATTVMSAIGRGAGGARMEMDVNGATVLSGKMRIAQLINLLSRAVDRPILDSTGLTGTYDIELTYLAGNSPVLTELRARADAMGAGAETRQPDAAAPIATVFQAVKTLGLALDAKKSPTEMIVIDSANKVPTEN